MIAASCHCGAVRFEIAAKPASVTECNCSMCGRLGVRWAYYQPDQVKALGAPDATRGYVWGDRTIEFHHCHSCGCTTHYVSLTDQPRVAVNARLMAVADIKGIPIRKLDGASSWEYLDDESFVS